MYCPRCATEFQDGSNETYCRGCGMELGPVTSLVTGDSPPPGRRHGPNSPLMRLGMAIFILGLVVALLNAALAGFIGVPEVYGKTFFLLMVAIGMGCLGLGLVIPRSSLRRKTLTPRGAQHELSSPATTTNLRPIREEEFAVSSVTENTTRNLN